MAVPREEARPVLDRTPPQNVELEMCVLGGIMLEPKEAYTVAADYLGRDSFYLDGHGLIFELMGELHRRGFPPDSAAVLDELRARNVLDRVGGSGVLMGMLNSVPTAANVEYHAKKVAEKAHLRSLIHGCTKVIEEAYTQELPPEQVVDNAEAMILKLSDKYVQHEFLSLSAVLREYMDQLDARSTELRERREAGEKNPRISVGLPTGFIDLDVMTGGLRASELTIIAARASMGKTSLGLNFAHNIAVRHGLPVAIFSLEMGAEQLAERLLCTGTMYTEGMRIRGVSTTRLQNPDLTDAEWKVLTEAYQRIVAAPVYLDDSSLLTIRMLKSKSRRLHAHQKVQCIIVDYLQLMTTGTASDNRVQEVSEISRGLKQIARELKIPVVALSQLSRQVEARHNKKPQLSDLRESGAIEQDADVVMFIHRPDYYEEAKTGEPGGDKFGIPGLSEAEIIVAKNRNGPTGTAKMYFYKEITRFLDKSGK
ncbi:replicative DNA helicase [bacterium]|nr:replicative DNA helicase [bacterium]